MYLRLKGKRVSLGYTQKDMASKMNISESSYNLKENGKRDFTMDEIKIILEILDCKYEDIFL